MIHSVVGRLLMIMVYTWLTDLIFLQELLIIGVLLLLMNKKNMCLLSPYSLFSVFHCLIYTCSSIMKASFLFTITMATFAANVSARLYCKCSDLPLLDQRTRTCCETKGTKGTLNKKTGICEVNTSSGKAKEDFIGCCTQGATGIYGSCKVDKWKGGEENSGPGDLPGMVLDKYIDLTSSEDSLTGML